MIEYPFVYALQPAGHPDSAFPVPTRMRYDPDDPWAVTIIFSVPQGDGTFNETIWVFARDLLIEAFDGPVGAGDIKVWIDEDGEKFNLMLRSPDGQAHVWTDTDSLRIFLNHTTQMVPVGGESDKLNIEKELHDLMEQ
jgi:hypothetical protein